MNRTSVAVSVSSRRLPRTRHGLLAAVAAALVAASAGADQPDHVRRLGDLSIKELMELNVDSVYGASRYLQKTERVPASVTVVTADEIEKFGARSLEDVLNSVRGLYVPSDRNYSYLGIRGFQRPNDYDTRILVLIDGHRMNDNIYDLGAVGREGMVDVDLIDRVEVIRGPSSSIYGSSAFFGVINVVTKHGGSVHGLEASAEGGTFDSYKSRLTYGKTFANGADWLVSAARYTSAGAPSLYFPEFDQRVSGDPRAAHDGVARNLDGEDTASLFTTLRVGDFTTSGFWNGRIKHVPTASYGTVFGDPREETHDYRSYLDLRYDHHLTDDLSVQARAFYDDYTYSGTYPYDWPGAGLPDDTVLYKDRTVGRWAGTEWQLTADVADRHTLIFGAEYRDNLREYQSAYYDLEPRAYDILDERSSHTLGLFAQSETAIRDNLRLTAGVRYDRYSDEATGAVSPRMGLIFGFRSGGTIKALYGEAFRAPNPYERYYYTEQRNRPDLRPETIRTYELVYERTLGRGYRLTASGYRYRVHDLINQASTSADDLYFDNLDSARADGLELEIDRQFESGALLRASYALQNAVDGRSGERLTSSPRQMGKLNLSLPFGGRFSAGIELQYQAAVRTLGGDQADDFLTANLTLLRTRLGRGFEFSTTVYNLFDARYGYPGGEDQLQDVIEQNGRTFFGRLDYRF